MTDDGRAKTVDVVEFESGTDKPDNQLPSPRTMGGLQP